MSKIKIRVQEAGEVLQAVAKFEAGELLLSLLSSRGPYLYKHCNPPVHSCGFPCPFAMDNEIEAIRKARRAGIEAAQPFTHFRKPLPLDHKKVRFPGFHQRTTVFKAGKSLKPGARKLDVDIIRHESVPTALRDGTIIYSDIFFPAAFTDLTTTPKVVDPVPAIISWYV